MADIPAATDVEPTPADPDLDGAAQAVRTLLAHMRVEAAVSAAWGEPDPEDGERTLVVDVHGNDLSILLGRRGETLAALQYVARLLLAKQLSPGVNLLVDVEGYRQRRREQLRRMAQRTAEQVLQRGRAIALEPMPADERRIVHLELRDHPAVRTESSGEGARRKVSVHPK